MYHRFVEPADSSYLLINAFDQVYQFPSVTATGTSGGVTGTHTSVPKEVFCANLGQSVRSLEVGRVSSSDSPPEVVACTFRGRVCSLKTQALGQVRAMV